MVVTEQVLRELRKTNFTFRLTASPQARQGDERVEKKRHARRSGNNMRTLSQPVRGRSEVENYAAITVPMVPPSVNSYVRHTRSGRHFKTTEATRFADWLCLSCVDVKPVIGEKFHVGITIFLGEGQKGDVDNFPKMVLDTLAKRGMFESPKGKKLSDSHITRLTVQKSRSRMNPRTVIFIGPSKDYLEEV